jgi:hypothetical protein
MLDDELPRRKERRGKMNLKDYLWIFTAIIGAILGFLISVLTEMYKNRRQRIDDIREAISKLIAQYHESVKLSFQKKDEGSDNTIGWFLRIIENPNDNCITTCDQVISKAFYHSAVSMDFIHRHIVNFHYGKILKYISGKLNNLSLLEYDEAGNDYMAKELNKIKIRDFRIISIMFIFVVIITSVFSVLHRSDDVIKVSLENSIDTLNNALKKDYPYWGAPISFQGDYGILEVGNKANPTMLTIRTQEITNGLNLIFKLPNEDHDRIYPITNKSYFPRHYSIEIGKYKFFILVENIKFRSVKNIKWDSITIRIFSNNLGMCHKIITNDRYLDSTMNVDFNN